MSPNQMPRKSSPVRTTIRPSYEHGDVAVKIIRPLRTLPTRIGDR